MAETTASIDLSKTEEGQLDVSLHQLTTGFSAGEIRSNLDMDIFAADYGSQMRNMVDSIAGTAVKTYRKIHARKVAL